MPKDVLAVEVLSPDDRPGAVAEKVVDWLTAGCEAVWIVDPVRKIVTVHRRGAAPRAFRATEEMDGGEVLPGFRTPVGEFFSQ